MEFIAKENLESPKKKNTSGFIRDLPQRAGPISGEQRI